MDNSEQVLSLLESGEGNLCCPFLKLSHSVAVLLFQSTHQDGQNAF